MGSSDRRREDLPPLPPGFNVPDRLIDHDLLYLQCKLIYDTLLEGGDARSLLWALSKTEGDYVAGLATRFVYEPVGVFLLNHATPEEVFKTARQLSRLLVTAREIALRISQPEQNAADRG